VFVFIQLTFEVFVKAVCCTHNTEYDVLLRLFNESYGKCQHVMWKPFVKE